MPISPLVEPGQFHGLEGVAHLCTGGEAPWLKRLDSVYAEFARLKSGGEPGRQEIYARGEACRRRLGELWGVSPRRVSFAPSAAEGMSWLARGLDWREGDNIVTTDLEFPSVAYAWRHLRRRGVEVRMVPHRDWVVSETDLLQAVDGHTRVLAVSQVSFYTGQNLDIEQLAQGLRGSETLLAVDATHATGVVRVPAAVTDLCVSSAYKWLLATHGIAPCYMSDRADERTAATSFGWHNLQVWPPQQAERHGEVQEKPMPERLEPGNPAMVVVMFLHEALGLLLELGTERIQGHALALGAEIAARLTEMGRQVISPQTLPGRSGNTCFLARDAHSVQEQLAARGVLTWGEFGRVRISGHVHNGSEDVDRLVAALRQAAG
jgi:cysteine desulfurase / selenocysteine lyase